MQTALAQLRSWAPRASRLQLRMVDPQCVTVIIGQAIEIVDTVETG